MMVSRRIRGVAPSLIKKMSCNSKDVVSLASGIPKVNVSIAKSSLANLSLKDEMLRYTDQAGLPELRTLIAEQLNMDQENVLITAGATSALMGVFLTILDPDDEVILFSPTYPAYIEQAQIAIAKPVLVEWADSGMNLDCIKAAINQKTKAIVLCSPSNPNGTVASEEDLAALARICADNKIYLIYDGTYSQLVYDSDPCPISVAAEIAGQYLIGIGSFSKDLALSGLRIGYVYADTALISEISKATDALEICAPAISQYIVLDLLNNNMFDEITRNTRAELMKRRNLMCARLNRLQEQFTYSVPKGGLFVFAKLKKQVDDITFCEDLISKAKVALVPGSAFGKKAHVRLSFGVTEAEINLAFDRIEYYFAKHDGTMV